MKHLAAATLVLAFAGLAGMGAEVRLDPTGTWKWSAGFGGRPREATLKLKMDGDVLTGAMIGWRGEERPIEDLRYKDGEISFTVTRGWSGRESTIRYMGKVIGNTIRGKIEFERGGQTQSRDWRAERVKE